MALREGGSAHQNGAAEIITCTGPGPRYTANLGWLSRTRQMGSPASISYPSTGSGRTCSPGHQMRPQGPDTGGAFQQQAARSARLAAHRWQGVNQLTEDHRIVTVGSGDAEHQRDALAVRDDMALAAKLSSVRGIGARARAPRGLATLAPSMLTRLKSSLPALRNSSKSSRCRLCHTCAACQSRRRRQQVIHCRRWAALLRRHCRLRNRPWPTARTCAAAPAIPGWWPGRRSWHTACP